MSKKLREGVIDENLIKKINNLLPENTKTPSNSNSNSKPKPKPKSKSKEYLVHTTYTCSECKTHNTDFKITKNKIQQVCKCTTREHFLPEKIVSKL